MVTASRDWAVTWAVTELWPAVTEPWSYWRCRDWAVTSPWLSCDLAVTELWPRRDWAVTSPSRDWAVIIGPGAVTTVVTVSSQWAHRELTVTIFFLRGYAFLCLYLNYCIEVWGNTFPTYITPLNRLQNKAISVILGCNKRTHLQPLYASLKMLDISKIYMYNVQIFMFKRYHCLAPDIFNSFFCKNVDITGRETRQSENLRIPEGVIGIRRRTIRFSGVSLYNVFHNKIS